MSIRSSYSGPDLKHSTIGIHHQERLAFNFSFLTKDKEYNLNKRSKTVTKRVRLKLLERIAFLSASDKTSILLLPREKGLENLAEREVALRPHPDFVRSGRMLAADDGYWIFRLNDVGRVIGKIDGIVYYILAIDPKFDLYQH